LLPIMRGPEYTEAILIAAQGVLTGQSTAPKTPLLPLECAEKWFVHFSVYHRRVQGPMVNILITLYPGPAGLYRLPTRINAAGLIDHQCRPRAQHWYGRDKGRLRSTHAL